MLNELIIYIIIHIYYSSPIPIIKYKVFFIHSTNGIKIYFKIYIASRKSMFHIFRLRERIYNEININTTIIYL